MKKIFVVLNFLVMFFVCSACGMDLDSDSELTDLIIKNGADSSITYEQFGIKGVWKVIKNGTEGWSHSKCPNVKYGAFIGEQLVGLEFETEKEALEATKLMNTYYSYSYYNKGKFSFPAKLGSFILFFGEDSFTVGDDDNMWLEDGNEKILLLTAADAGKNDGILKIDGFTSVSAYAIAGSTRMVFNKIIVGKTVKTLYYGAFQSRGFEVIEFNGDVEVIYGGIVVSKHNEFKYTVIPDSVKFIGYRAFARGDIYFEHESRLDSWDPEFICGTAKAYWAGEWEYDENGVPHPIEKVTSDNITEEV